MKNLFMRIKKFIILAINSILLFNLCVQYVFADENVNKSTKHLEIIHLQQSHPLSDPSDDDASQTAYELYYQIKGKKIVLSQYNIAKYILKNPAIPVFGEALYEDIDYSSFGCGTYGSICTTIQEEVFPAGFPDRFDSLTKHQKRILYSYGGGPVLVLLGIIPKIHKTIEQKLNDELKERFERLDVPIDHPIEGIKSFLKRKNPQAYVDIYETRDKAAISSIKEAFENTPQDFAQGQVFLIFGADHDFREECQKYGYKLTEVNLADASDNRNRRAGPPH